ncbi:hypothetical protein BGZ65_007315 [Modicella reniformis]|uniref:Uncharacterized protein n=1 Tax=Modicella reniformis TaxID=1440133 RepID=A0A9P6MFJ1_9FUNG|nr:hypothetical protein BGZ65_007315 [Modicella reniformis]
MAGSMDEYREMIKILAIWKGLPENVRLYAKQLNDYFKTKLGDSLQCCELLLNSIPSHSHSYSQFIRMARANAPIRFDSPVEKRWRASAREPVLVSARHPHPHVQQENNNESSPPPPFPQTPPCQEDLGFDSDIDDGTSILEEDDFVETDDTGSFHLGFENKKIYDEASEWFENTIQRKIDDTIKGKGLRTDRFSIPWIHACHLLHLSLD